MLLYPSIDLSIDLLVRRRVLIRECFQARRLRRALKLLRPSPRQLPRGSSHLEAPEALGAAISKLQRLSEQPSRGARGSGSSHLKAPEALGAAISRLQRLSRLKWLQSQFYRVFSSILEPGDLLGSSPNGSGRLEEASGGFEPAQEGFPVASSGLESAPKWPRSE